MIFSLFSKLGKAWAGLRQKIGKKSPLSSKRPSVNPTPAGLSPKISRALYYLEKLKGLDTLGDCLAFGYDNRHVMETTMQELPRNGQTLRFFGFDSSSYLSYMSGRKRRRNPSTDLNGGALVSGRYSATLNAEEKSNYNIRKASLILIDAQLHSSVKKALEFSFPLVPAHAMVIFYNCNNDRFWGDNNDALKIFSDMLSQNRSLQAKELETYYNKENPDCRIFLVSNVYYQQKLAMVSKHCSKQGDMNLGEFVVFPVSDN
jgi:hypothetical protein